MCSLTEELRILKKKYSHSLEIQDKQSKVAFARELHLMYKDYLNEIEKLQERMEESKSTETATSTISSTTQQELLICQEENARLREDIRREKAAHEVLFHFLLYI